MYYSSRTWSKLSKQLEDDFLCAALRGRVRYFYTKYRKSHVVLESRFAVLVDNTEVFKANDYNEFEKYLTLEEDLRESLNIPWNEAREFVKDTRLKNFDYSSDDIFKSLEFYLSYSIKESLESSNLIVKMFAILDRRVGKRTLSKLTDELQYLPEWLQYFNKLRLDAENITYK